MLQVGGLKSWVLNTICTVQSIINGLNLINVSQKDLSNALLQYSSSFITLDIYTNI